MIKSICLTTASQTNLKVNSCCLTSFRLSFFQKVEYVATGNTFQVNLLLSKKKLRWLLCWYWVAFTLSNFLQVSRLMLELKLTRFASATDAKTQLNNKHDRDHDHIHTLILHYVPSLHYIITSKRRWSRKLNRRMKAKLSLLQLKFLLV